MRWVHTDSPKPGMIRHVKKFLWLPKTLPLSRGSKHRETRWLETAVIEQEYVKRTEIDIEPVGGYSIDREVEVEYWKDVEWENRI